MHIIMLKRKTRRINYCEDDEDNSYFAQTIVDSIIMNGEVLYRVRWKGFPQEEDTWQPRCHLEEVVHLISSYQKKMPVIERCVQMRRQMREVEMRKWLLYQKVERQCPEDVFVKCKAEYDNLSLKYRMLQKQIASII